ncbi:ATP-binding protein [Gluconacetobacter diazotrophicus]|uniref:ATP-binding protein n=1 Tax=Gluconacetobacter diazotrophicus TaxID=33996 RepID=UPI00119C2F02|nr:ATP-binding protein [Gluconacetobacter diazotrophicus]TWB02479.1 signal transduction histidine kinase [Gluconacetobacter diazotrophicus]
MAFKVAARAVLELGAELISSDEIAIYELVKNAFDARSPTVDVIFKVRIRRTEYEALIAPFVDPIFEDKEGNERKPTSREERDDRAEFLRTRQSIAQQILAKGLRRTARLLSEADGRKEAREILRRTYNRLSTITVRDSGDGMNAKVLREAFLTIGTAYRLRQRRRPSLREGERSLLGEKGVGRLSAMRLGSQLDLTTGTAADENWNCLRIDWNSFALEDDTLVGEVSVDPFEGDPKGHDEKGTTLVISGLEADWTKEKLERIAVQEFSRISDPFLPRSKTFPLNISFNGEDIKMRRLSSELFKHAHGVCTGRLRLIQGVPRFNADFEYKLYGERATFEKGPDELRDAVTKSVPPSALRTLGEIDFRFYWFNRQLLKAIDGIGTVTDVRKLVNSWSGGLMIYRDGFRVNPYGGPGDDWLELNRQAFRSSGYLLNSDQIIGRIQISSDGNPKLVDQTNREGLRDNFEFQALKNLLHQFITVDLKRYIDRINDEYSGLKSIDFKAVDKNVESYERRVEKNIASLKKLFPEQLDTLVRIQESFQSMRHAYAQARDTVQRTDEHVQRLMDLAGVGLLVEVVAHELARATKHTLDLVTSARRRVKDNDLERTFNSVEGQLTTIERRLRVLDPLSISGRQRKTSFDLVEIIRDVFAGREEDLSRANIGWSIEAPSHVQVTAVKGMLYQTIENLVSNSIHWLARAREEHPELKARIWVQVSPEHGGSFRFTDNGPGISIKLADAVFEAFFTTRGESGRGLGLYIARTNAQHHGGDIRLVGLSDVHPDRFNTFEVRMSTDEHN